MPVEDFVRFTLTATDDASEANGVKYDLQQHPSDVNRVLRTDGKLEAKHQQRLRMSFTLVDQSSHNLEFVSDVSNTFLVKEGHECPTRHDTDEHPSFPKNRFRVSMPGSDQVLTVANLNLVQGTYYYRICIDGGGQERDFDPVILNGGGGQNKLPTWLALLVGLLGLAAVMGIAYALGLLG